MHKENKVNQQNLSRKYRILNNIFSDWRVKWIGVPILLLLLWLTLSLIFHPFESFSLIGYGHDMDAIRVSAERLTKGEKLVGQFVAKENNLGIITIHLAGGKVHNSEFEDYLIFRIKEKNSLHWHYESLNKIGLVKEQFFFTFGFPLIENARGKEYIFEIISTKGNRENTVSIEKRNPFFFSKYKFTVNGLLNNPSELTKFVFNKVNSFLHNKDSLIATSIYFLPFFFYMTWHITSILFSKFRNYLFDNSFFVFTILFFIMYDIVFINISIASIVVGLVGFWLMLVYRRKYESSVSFKISFALFFLGVILIQLKAPIIMVEKASDWTFAFFAIGTLLITRELKGK